MQLDERKHSSCLLKFELFKHVPPHSTSCFWRFLNPHSISKHWTFLGYDPCIRQENAFPNCENQRWYFPKRHSNFQSAAIYHSSELPPHSKCSLSFSPSLYPSFSCIYLRVVIAFRKVFAALWSYSLSFNMLLPTSLWITSHLFTLSGFPGSGAQYIDNLLVCASLFLKSKLKLIPVHGGQNRWESEPETWVRPK